jgi:Ca2+-transporting ATPase
MTRNHGLTTQEAQTRLAKYGPNEITHKSAHTPWQILTTQFKSPLILLLFVATAISFSLGDTLEGILILAIVGLNALLGFFQEYKAERALEALKKIAVSIVRVTRDGVQREIDSKLLVPGDLIFLEEGNKVPADARLIENMHLEAEEAALTGESLPVAKEVAKTSEVNLFMGTVVARGRGTAVIVSTGMQTRFGTIASALSSIQKEETQLEKKLAIIAKQLGMVAIIAGAVISAIGISHGFTFVSILLTAVSLAVAAVPEGLPAVITVTLAIGTQRMAKKKAILRKLSAIESLGGITVIATDKTGTLTKNEMRVTRVWAEDTNHPLNTQVFAKNKTLTRLLTTGIVCNNATLAPVEGAARFDVVGDKTEGALLLLSESVGISYERIKTIGALVEEFAFDPQSKTMSIVWKHAQSTTVYTKGAPEAILLRSSSIMTKSGIKPLNDKEKTRVISAYEDFAKDGLRCIALATKPIHWKKQDRAAVENDLTFLGFVGISDPPREEVAAAIAQADAAGIRTIMITGDNELTGHAIAKHIKLIKKGEEVITGAQFASLTEEQKRAKLPHIRVFARTSPEQKLEIVRLLQEQNHIVAVTGDGVNDALALKQANVGVAMGITGTDVAKEAADMIITDDNYATIVTAVEEGRIIYQNMKASIKYLIGSNIGEVLALLVGAILGWPFILLPIQILYINLVTDGLPALALALNHRHHNIMKRAPQKGTELFTRYDIRWLIEVSVLTMITTLVAFWIGWQQGDLNLARTLAFIVIAFAQQCIFLDIIAGDRSMLSRYALKNTWTLVPLATIGLQLALMYTTWFQEIFSTVSAHWMPLGVSILFCCVMLGIAELRKRFLRNLFYER